MTGAPSSQGSNDERDLRTPPSPSEIAPHAVIEIAFGVDADGVEFAIVEGVDVVPHEGEDARDAAIRTVAQMVDTVAGIDSYGNPYRYLRARIVGDSVHRSVLIQRDGRLYVSIDDEGTDGHEKQQQVAVTDMGSQPFTEKQVGDAAELLLGVSTPAATTDEPGTGNDAGHKPPSSSGGSRALLRGPTAASDRTAARARRRTRLMEQARLESEGTSRRQRVSRAGRSFTLIAAAAVTVVLAILLIVDKLGSPQTPTAVTVALSVAPPPEWAQEVAWSTGPLSAEAGPTLGLTDRIGYVTAEREVLVADIATGEAQWRLELPAGPIRGPLSRTRLVETDAIALHVGDRLLVWSVENGKPVAALDLPPEAEITYLGDAPLVGIGPSTVAVVGSEGLTEITVPEGAYALAARADGSVTAAAPTGWWHLRAGRESGAARPWESPSADSRPADSLPAITGYIADSIVVAYPAFRDRLPEVVVHTDRADDVRVSFRGPLQGTGSAQSAWLASPSDTWGILGRTLVDIRAGSVSDLGAWQTLAVTTEQAFGQVGEELVVVGPGSAPAALPAGTQTPETTTPDGALIRLRGPLSDTAGEVLLPEGVEAAFVVPPAP